MGITPTHLLGKNIKSSRTASRIEKEVRMSDHCKNPREQHGFRVLTEVTNSISKTLEINQQFSEDNYRSKVQIFFHCPKSFPGYFLMLMKHLDFVHLHPAFFMVDFQCLSFVFCHLPDSFKCPLLPPH